MSYQIQIGSHQLKTSGGETLLETFEQGGIPTDAQCRQGYCGACRMQLTAGQVHYHQPPLAYLAPQQILICCAKPKSDIELQVECVAQS